MINRKLGNVIDGSLMRLLRWMPASKFTEWLALRWGRSFRPDAKFVPLRCKLYCYLHRQDYIQLMVRYHGIFEPHCIRIMEKILGSGSTFLDIGANIGVHSLFASTMVKSTGKVISIEAESENFEILNRNISHSNAGNVTALHYAVGEAPGTVSMHLPIHGNSGMYQVKHGGNDEVATVPMRTIDFILGELKVEKVDLLKMDIEGSEFAAIRGARATLQQLRMPILIEINRAALGQFNTSPKELKQELHDLGYDGWIIAGWQFVPISVDDEHDCDECLFLHRNDAINRSRFAIGNN